MEKKINVDELYHHGIKDMHWGQRRYQNPDGSLTPLGKIRYGTSSNYNKVQKAKAAIKKEKAKLAQQKKKDRADAEIKALRKKAGLPDKNSKKTAKPEKSVSEMTNAEIEEKIKRLNLEQQLKNLSPKPERKIFNGKEFTRKMVNDALIPAATNAVKNVAEDWMKKKFREATGLNVGETEEARLRRLAENAKNEMTIAFNQKSTYMHQQDLKKMKERDAKAAREEAQRQIDEAKAKTKEARDKATQTVKKVSDKVVQTAKKIKHDELCSDIDYLMHVGVAASSQSHKYVARVPYGKNQYRYFYSQQEYQAYMQNKSAPSSPPVGTTTNRTTLDYSNPNTVRKFQRTYLQTGPNQQIKFGPHRGQVIRNEKIVGETGGTTMKRDSKMSNQSGSFGPSKVSLTNLRTTASGAVNGEDVKKKAEKVLKSLGDAYVKEFKREVNAIKEANKANDAYRAKRAERVKKTNQELYSKIGKATKLVANNTLDQLKKDTKATANFFKDQIALNTATKSETEKKNKDLVAQVQKEANDRVANARKQMNEVSDIFKNKKRSR